MSKKTNPHCRGRINATRVLNVFIFTLLIIILEISIAFAEKMESGGYKMVFSSAISSLSKTAESDAFSVTNFVVGNTVPTSEEGAISQSGTVTLSFADMYFSGVVAKWISYQISDVLIKEDRFGVEIAPETWTKDNDPYFYWIVFLDPPTLITGYSFSLDEEPDDVIDTSDSFLQYDDDIFPEGKHTFYVKPKALSGIWGPPISVDIWVDSTAPLVDGLTPTVASLVRGKSIEVSCGLSDENSGIDFSATQMIINNVSVNAEYDEERKMFIFNSSTMLDGENVVMIKARDFAGNETIKTWSFIVDNEIPVGTVFINNDDSITDNPYVVLKILAEDNISGIDKMFISFDGIFDKELLSPLEYKPLVENFLLDQADLAGIKSVYVVFEDAAGNMSIAASDTIQLLIGYPDTRIVSSPEAVTDDTSSEFVYESTRPEAFFSYSIDGDSFSDWSLQQSVTFSGLAEGNHIFKVKAAIDLNDNGVIDMPEIDPTPAQWVWVVSSEAADEGLIERLRKTLYFKRK